MTMSSLLEHFDDLLVTPENAEQLNRAILELALHGKLTHQETGDGSVKKLLKSILDEKTVLGIDVDLQPIKESDKPFGLPNGWEWIKLEHLLPEYQNGLGRRMSASTGKERIILRLADLGSGKIRTDNSRSFILPEEEIAKYDLREGDILITRVNGSIDLIGSFALITDGDLYSYCDHFIRMRLPINKVLPVYLVLISKSDFVRAQIKEKFITTAGQKTVNQRHISSLFFPLPPLAEQQRIVSRVEELFARTRTLAKELTRSQIELDGLNKSALSHLLASETPEEFDQHWAFIAEHFDLLFQTLKHVAPLRQSILELAVRGKLTRREAGNESAGELLKCIKEEKEKQGLTQSPPNVKEEDKTFDLPEGWEWCHAGDLFLFTTSGSRGWAKYYSDDGPIFLRIGNLDYESIDLDLRHIQRVQPPQTVERERIRVQPRDILVSMTGDVGMIAVVKDGELDEAYINQHIGLNRPSKRVLPAFLGYTFISPHGLGQLFKSRKGIKNSLALNDMTSVVIALPPLAEQERIVKRVEQLLSLCDALEARLRSAEEERGRLVRAVMAGVS